MWRVVVSLSESVPSEIEANMHTHTLTYNGTNNIENEGYNIKTDV